MTYTQGVLIVVGLSGNIIKKYQGALRPLKLKWGDVCKVER